MNVRRRAWLALIAAGPVLSLVGVRPAAGENEVVRVIDVRIENRRMVSPERFIRVTHEDMVELRITTDEPVELHLHGYDIVLVVEPGTTGLMVVDAHETGRFPITSHRRDGGELTHEDLTYFEVYPR